MNRPPQPEPTSLYQIKVKGHLHPAWSEWFEQLALTHHPDGYTSLTGRIIDQAALHGVLIKIRDLGLTLISVQHVGTLPQNPDD
ncbi:MAG TPA: hypothetical protein PKE45_24295 [Caldilineaceae bacterium]|nr:hypothetical protein [Caldilineaceae bacterium]